MKNILKNMFGRKSNINDAWRLGQKYMYSARIGHKRKHKGSHQFLNTSFPNSVPVSNAVRLKKSETSGKLVI